MTKQERSEYNSNYYIKHKRKLQKAKKIRYRTDKSYRESIKAASIERQRKLNKKETKHARKEKKSS